MNFLIQSLSYLVPLCVSGFLVLTMISNSRHGRHRLDNLSGVIAMVLIMLGLFMMRPFMYFPTPSEAQESFARNPSAVSQGAISASFGIVLLVWFAGSVYDALRRAGSDRLATIAFGGAVITATSQALGGSIYWAAAARTGAHGGISAETAVEMYDLGIVMLASMQTCGLAIWLWAAGIGSLYTRLFPAWLTWGTIATAVGLVSPVHYIFEGVSFLWIVTVSVWLYLHDERESVLSAAKHRRSNLVA